MNAIITLASLSLVTLLSEIFRFKKAILPLILIGLGVAGALTMSEWNTGKHLWHNMVYIDNYSVLFTMLLVGLCFLWFLHSASFFVDREDTVTDKYALVLFSLVGAVCLTNFSHMVMLFLGIEIISIPMYVLAGSRKFDIQSNEASMKYFLMGAFATGFLLFGIALIYGVTGSFQLQTIGEWLATNQAAIPAMFYAGILLMMIGLFFKIAAVPFHFWTPDVYQGAPTIITTYMATIVKTAAFAAFFRLFAYTFTISSSFWLNTVWVVSGLTILTGNITAVFQSNVKRMLAYSGVAHAGYMLLALLALNDLSQKSLLLYAAAYSVSTIASFSVLNIVFKLRGSDDISSFKGLAKTNPFLAVVTVISMLSLAGIPPTAGFFAKYYIFTAAIKEGYLNLIIIAILGSLIGVFYYLRVIMALFSETETESPKAQIPFTTALAMVLSALIILALGLYPNAVLGLV